MPGLAWYLESFFLLQSSRTIGMEAGPIPLSEMVAYLDLMNVRSLEERMRFVQLLQAMDRTARKVQREQANNRAKMPPAR